MELAALSLDHRSICPHPSSTCWTEHLPVSSCPEERAGGDILVTDTRSHLPGELSHHTNPVNHAAALWDPTIQTQVSGILHTMVSQASFVSQSLPQTMSVGVTYPVSITMQNTGSSTWMSRRKLPLPPGHPEPAGQSGLGSQSPGRTRPRASRIAGDVQLQHHRALQRRLLPLPVAHAAGERGMVRRLYPRLLHTRRPGNHPVVSGLTVSPTSVASGRTVAITVTLSAPAPAAGLPVTVTSSNRVRAVPALHHHRSRERIERHHQRDGPSGSLAGPVTLTAINGATATAQLTVTPAVAQYPYGSRMTAGVGGSLL